MLRFLFAVLWPLSAIAGSPAPPASLPVLRFTLSPDNPPACHGELLSPEGLPVFSFPVGLGRDGVLPPGSRFQAGYTLLGWFRINAILTPTRFEMEESLIQNSHKSRDWLAAHLFTNMNAIDFDGDGRAGEYGAAYLSLAPLSNTPQPFSFHSYRGVFRWYSFAIHGAQDESRVGKRITGGCLNATSSALAHILPYVQVGDHVEIRSLQ